MIESDLLEKHTTTTEWLPVTSITIDMEYQRTLSGDKVNTIAANFNEAAAGTLAVNLRGNGQYVVMDGQHRLEAMKKLGITHAECKVCRGLTQQQETQVYLYCQTGRKTPDAIDVFRARLIAEDPVAIAINSVVEKCGLHIQFHHIGGKGGRRLPNSLWAVTALETIYKRGKEKLLENVLTLIIRSWPGEGSSFEAKVLLGIANFHMKHQTEYSREEFIAKMNITDLNSLRRRAQYHAENGGHASTAFAKALEEAYNKGKRTRRLESKS